MVAPLADCTNKEWRVVIRFLLSDGMSKAKIHQRFLTEYRNSTRPKIIVYEKIEKFKSARTSVDHWKHSHSQ